MRAWARRAGKTTLALAVAATLGATLAGCEGPHQGIVHDKDWSPGYWWTPPCFSSGKNSVCVSIPEYEPPTYRIDVYASRDDHGWVEVDAATFHRLAIGDRWDGR